MKNSKILKKNNLIRSLENPYKIKLNINKINKLKENLFSNLNNKKSIFAQRFLTEITPEENKNFLIKEKKNYSFNKKINHLSFSKNDYKNKENVPKIKTLKRYFSQANINEYFKKKKIKIKKSATEANFDFSYEKEKKKTIFNKKYEKFCNNINHLHKKKLISFFLTPMNNFIKNDFKLFYDDYEKINNKIILKYSNINPIKKKFLIPKLPKIPFNLQNNFYNFKYKI